MSSAHPSAINTEVKGLLNAKYNLQSYDFRKIIISIQIFILVALVSLLTACGATIPKGSVDLSREVGVGLQKQYQSQIDLVNICFSVRRKMLDEAMRRKLDKYFESLTPNDSIELGREQLGGVAADVMSISKDNQVAKEELEKERLLLIKQLNENYLRLNQANSSITGLLQSAVDVKEATSESYKKLSEVTGGEIDLDGALSELYDSIR